jgi:Tol biopolymer transport system component
MGEAWLPRRTNPLERTTDVAHPGGVKHPAKIAVGLAALAASSSLVTTPSWGDASPPGCSRAGSRIAFIRDLHGDVGFELFTVRPNGTGLKRITKNKKGEWGPSWSPDGRQLAFSSHRDGDSDIFVVNRDGSGLRKLTHNEWSDELPDWSPGGRRIVYSSTKGDEHDSDFDLFIMNSKGVSKKLVGGRNVEANASWSPNGGRIAFDRNDAVYTIRTDGSELTRLTPKGTVTSNPAFSNDGRHIAFQNDFIDTTWMDIYRMRTNGEGMKPVLQTENNEQSPSWSPDDALLAHSDEYQLSVAPADGSQKSDHLFEGDNTEYAVDWGPPVPCN